MTELVATSPATERKQPTGSLSSTNFDLPSLYLLRPEINVVLDNAETHLSEFNDDEEQAPLLLDSIEVLGQLAAILDLISLAGGSDLAELLSDSMKSLYDAGDNTNDDLILNISEGIMTLDRYIEFVLLKETLEPSLLLPVINRLSESIGRTSVDASQFNKSDKGSYHNISIANPEQNYDSVEDLGLDGNLLATAYRSGLNVALTKKDATLTDEEKQKLQAMASACAMVSAHSKSLFWRAAEAVTQNLASALPLSNPQKRTLVFLEQQFKNYLPANDNRFADLVSFACQRDNSIADAIKQEFSSSRLNDSQLDELKRHLLGPDREVANKLNTLIQDEISLIKDKVDALVRGDSKNPAATEANQIAEKLNNLASVMRLLNIDSATEAFTTSASHVKGWQNPTPEDFDALLTSLMVGENEAIYMAKSHTPGSVMQPLHNSKISVYQLDTAYDTLVSESRTAIATVEQAISDYIADDDKDLLNLNNTPEMMRQVAGASSFLGLTDEANMLNRLATYMNDQVLENRLTLTDEQLADMADVLMAVDYHLEGLEQNHPVGSHAMHIGHQSLQILLVA